MIQVNELRIGNYVNVTDVDYMVQIKALSLRYGFQKVILGADVMVLDDWWMDTVKINPIPLTPEVLEKCGFVKYGESPFFSYRLKVNSSDELAWYSQDCELRYQTIGSGFTRNFNINYLHQLQNLLFALTGQELKISEK